MDSTTTPALTPLSYLDPTTSVAVLYLLSMATAATARRNTDPNFNSCLVHRKFIQGILPIPAAARCSLALQKKPPLPLAEGGM
jgi:hypothetical protein